MDKKKLFIIFITVIVFILVILGVAFTVSYLNDKSKYDYTIEKVTQINYNIINRNDKYGIIDRTGKEVVEPIYDNIQIPNPSKDIFICMHNYNIEKREYETVVLNSKREVIFGSYNNIQAIPTETSYDGIPFEKSVLKYKIDDKYGLLSIDGKKLTDAIYDQIGSIDYKEGMLLVKQQEKCGVVNMHGKEVIPVEYETITADNYYSNDTLYKTTGFIVSKKSDQGYRYGYINYKGNVILDTEYTEIERVTEIQDDNNIYIIAFKDGQAGLLKNQAIVLNYEYEDISYNLYNDLFIIQRNGKQGVVTREGTIKIPTEYESIQFGGIYVNAKKQNQLFILDLDGNKIQNQTILSKMPTKDGRHYIILDRNEIYKITDENESIIINKNYSYIEEIDNNYFIVANRYKNGIIDLSGKSVIDLKYNSIFKLDKTNLLQANISETGIIALIDKNMKIVVTIDNAKIQLSDSYVKIYSDNDIKYFDYDGKELMAKDALTGNLLYAKKINGKWGFTDKNGNLVVKNEYDMVTEFNEYGFAGIQKNGKWGSINSKGEIVQEPIYEIKWSNPSFIGKFYKAEEWYGYPCYTDNLKE